MEGLEIKKTEKKKERRDKSQLNHEGIEQLYTKSIREMFATIPHTFIIADVRDDSPAEKTNSVI